MNDNFTSIHAAHIEEIHDVPFGVLIRPFPSELEEDKVVSLMETLQNPETKGNVPPIDVLWVTGSEGGDYYYSFGGCHRYEAHKRLKLPSIRCKLVKSTIQDLKTYLGGSTPDLR
ncbi:putative sulfiredoxin [Nephila pilipes]|uniref:Sulfiredoxin n=1 Tax=Nephila pilipes TaxID=299642 RepID=A0A8X6Q1G6_NEPPI|nr:putative sulfiredoxin [Nephila pilipes]